MISAALRVFVANTEHKAKVCTTALLTVARCRLPRSDHSFLYRNHTEDGQRRKYAASIACFTVTRNDLAVWLATCFLMNF